MGDTKDAFAERTIRSLKKLLYRYMEDYSYKYIHKMTPFAALLNFIGNCSIDLIPKSVKDSNFLSILYSNHYENLKDPSLKLETDFASQSITYPSGTVTGQTLQRKFLKL